MNPNIDATRRAIGWFLLGLFVTTVMANLATFVSPVWAELRYGPGNAPKHRSELQALAVSAVPWLKCVYLVAVWQIARTLSSVTSRAVLMVAALAAISWPLVQLFALPNVSGVLPNLLASGLLYLVFVFCVWRAWVNLR